MLQVMNILCMKIWMQSGAVAPPECVTDMGRPILNAASIAFNQITFLKYNDVCLEILQGKPVNFSLNTQLRIDIAHLMNAVARWPCLKEAEVKVKKLYLFCLGYMSQITQLDEFAYFLQHIHFLALNFTYNKLVENVLNTLMKTNE